jgi:Co/Zn/Cd efflux system component
MSRRDPRDARTLGLWTAGWLGALLLAGLLWVGDLSVQWPVLLVPVVWALVALRRRRPLD